MLRSAVELMTCLIWDIQEEHLDEAEFLVEMWTNCVDSPKFTLGQLREGPERRLLARLDGLVVGGEAVVEGLLLPVIGAPDDDEFRTAAATLAIFRGAKLDACAQVLTALERAEEDQGRRGLVLGLIHAQRTGLIGWLGHDLDRLDGPALAARLLVLAGHRVDAGARMIPWLSADELGVRRAAALLARHTATPEALRQLDPAMDDDDDALRWAAIESGLIRQRSGAWERAGREAARVRSPNQRAALGWVAMLGDEAVQRRLQVELAAAPTPQLIWALGLSGRPRAVDGVLELLDHPGLARLAGEVVCAVAGLPTTENRFWLDRGVQVGADEDDALPALDDDDLTHELAPSGDDWLRAPDPGEVRFWWAERRDRFADELRHLDGRRLDSATLCRGLRELPTRRRHPLALELAARTAGRAQVVTTAMTAVQHAQMDATLTGLDVIDHQRGGALAAPA